MPVGFDVFVKQMVVQILLEGVWPQYEEIFQRTNAHDPKKERVVQLARGLYALQKRESASGRRKKPLPKNIESRAEAFLKEHLKALCDNRKGYLRALYRAQALLKNTDKWPLKDRGIIVLGIIFFRKKNPEWSTVNTDRLKEIVTSYCKISDRHWNRSLQHPDIVFLIKRDLVGKH